MKILQVARREYLEHVRTKAFILGIVLGPLIEGNFRKMLGQYGDVTPLFTQPIALTFIVMSVLSVGYSLWRRRRGGPVEGQLGVD